MSYIRIVRPLILAAALAAGALAQTVPSSDTLKLWYRKPAATWNEALPVGNGRLAAIFVNIPPYPTHTSFGVFFLKF